MAKLRISAAHLYDRLFGGMRPQPHVNFIDINFDAELQIVNLEIKGADVPEVEEVVAIVTPSKQMSIEFKAR